MDIFDLLSSDLSEKEQKILAASIKVFSEKGYSASTTSEIAKSAGIAEGTIFRYFKTKKDILRGVLIQFINMISGKLVLGGIEKIIWSNNKNDLRSFLKEVIYDRIKFLDNAFPMFRVILTEALIHEDVREALYNNIISKALDMFSETYKSLVEVGLVREGVELLPVFRNILGSMTILIMQKKLFGKLVPIEDFNDEIDKMIDLFLYGMTQDIQNCG